MIAREEFAMQRVSRLEELRTMRKALIVQMTSPGFVQAITVLANQARPKVCGLESQTCGCGEPLQRVYGSTVKIYPNCLV